MRARTATGLVAALAIAAGLLAGCTPDAPAEEGPRAVTSDEAQLLAIARFRNFDVGSRAFRTTVVEGGATIGLKGWVDYEAHLGYALVSGDFAPQALLWTETTVGIIPATPDAAGDPPLPIPELADPAWQSRPLDAVQSQLDAVLATLGNLGDDRPENPLLLQQSGALWLRADEVDGVEVTVFAAPPSDEPLPDGLLPAADESPLRLWLDETGLIRRAELRVGTAWTAIDLPDASAPRLELPEADG